MAEAGDPVVASSYGAYFKGVIPFRGIRAPALRQLFRENWPLLEDAPVRDAVIGAFQLLHRPFAEDKQVGVMVLHRNVSRVGPEFIGRLAPVFDETVNEWATCDALSGRVLRHLIKRSAAERRAIVAWSRARSLWRQRASAVSFVNEARHGEVTEDVVTVCRRIVRNPERFVQLGAGWALRELWLAEPAVVDDFLRLNYGYMSREGLRYAIEKMPKSKQQAHLRRHAEVRRTA
jgi:3-methyladenine DNA glycosylase AlkD